MSLLIANLHSIPNYYSTCLICNGKFPDIIQHLKSHRVAPQKYFNNYCPKNDILTGKLIQFKSFDQWILSDFVDKRNLMIWLKKNGPKISGQYLANKLSQYMNIKSWSCSPSQSLFGSIHCLPKIDSFEKFSKQPFNLFCAENNIKNIYDYSADKIVPREISQIIIDNREKRPLIIKKKKINIISDTLSYGDYAENKNSSLVIERKSKNDFFGTLSRDYDRFDRQIERAKCLNGYIVILVECQLSSILFGKKFFCNASPEFIMHRAREINKKYINNIQFLFCDGRAECSRLIPIILGLSAEKVSSLDLQYYYDKKLL